MKCERWGITASATPAMRLMSLPAASSPEISRTCEAVRVGEAARGLGRAAHDDAVAGGERRRRGGARRRGR